MDMATLSSFAGIGTLILVALLVLIGALKGRGRGFFRQLVRTVTVVASLFISIFLAKFVFNFLNTWMVDQTPADVMTTLEGFGINLGNLKEVLVLLDSEAFAHIMAVPISLIVLPIVFLLAFIVVSTLMRFIHAMLCKLFGFHKWRNNFFTRFLGFILGAAQGFAVAVICLVPIIGISTTVHNAVLDLEEKEPKSETTAVVRAFYDKNIKGFAEDPNLTLLGTLGGNMIYDMVTTVDVNGESHKMSEEVGVHSVKTYAALKTLVEIDWQYLTAKDRAAINTLINTAKESPYMAILLADVLDSMATAYDKETIPLAAEGLAKDFIDAVLAVFVDIDENSVVPTLEVIRDVLFMLDDENVLAKLSGDTSLLSEILSKKDGENSLISKVTVKLNSNQRTAPLVGTITKISITVMADSFETIDGVEINEETYENIKTGVTEVIAIDKKDYASDELYVEAIADSLSDTFSENGIVLDEAVVNGMAQHVADNYSETEELTDEEANDIILSYYSAYLETQNSAQ